MSPRHQPPPLESGADRQLPQAAGAGKELPVAGPVGDGPEAGAAGQEEEPEDGPYEELEDELEEDAEALFGRLRRAAGPSSLTFVYAPGGTNNSGDVRGGQHVINEGGPGGNRRVLAREGPIFAQEILEAQFGFAEPAWFPEALKSLDSRLLILTGESGAGRRTAALNLLRRHSGGLALRAVDSTMGLANWRPEDSAARGYLVDGLSEPEQLLEGWMVNRLVHSLRRAHARMVIVLPRTPRLDSELRRQGHVTLMSCQPPPTREVFDARFAARVPDASERARLLAALGEEALNDLLTMALAPAHVAELVEEVVAERADATTIRDRVGFLAEAEVPELIEKLQEKPFGLAFLLATSVFEGLDRRIISEEAERLLDLADGRLDAVLRGARAEGGSRSNPEFVFDDPLAGLLETIHASPQPREVHSASGYSYSVEAVRFTRHGQAEAVLRHVWREYGRLPGLMTDWLEKVGPGDELVNPVGNVMGMAARWGGGRRALSHIRHLAKSERRTSRQIAASAMGVAAEDPVLAGEVRHWLTRWSRAQSSQFRSTVAYTCATPYGFSRPGHALQLLSHVMEIGSEEPRDPVTRAVRMALTSLFYSGNEEAVLAGLSEWAQRDSRHARLALSTFTVLLREVPWLSAQLADGGEPAEQIVTLVHQALNDDDHFGRTRGALLSWCRVAVWREEWRHGVETLLSALSNRMQHGVLRLFHNIDQDEEPDLAGKAIARQALKAWRDGTPTSHRSTPQQGSSER